MTSTIFEREWKNPNASFLYKSKNAGVGVVADEFPKFPEQVIVVPEKGFPGNENASLSDLDPQTYLALMFLVRFMDGKMKKFSGLDGVRGIVHAEGFAVKDHPHVVMFPAVRGESAGLNEPSRHSDASVRRMLVQNTMKNLALTPDESTRLDVQLEKIAAIEV